MGRGLGFPDGELTTPGGGCLRFGPGEGGKGEGARKEKAKTDNLRHAMLQAGSYGLRNPDPPGGQTLSFSLQPTFQIQRDPLQRPKATCLSHWPQAKVKSLTP